MKSHNFQQALQNVRTVFTDIRYVAVTVVTAVLFYIVNVIILEGSVFFYGFKKSIIQGISFSFSLLLRFYQAVTVETFVTVTIISILFGILVSLVAYKTSFAKRASSKKESALTTVGIFLGVLAPGCAACGVGLISLLGFSSAFITFLPFDGLEISIVAILIMVYAIYHFSVNLTVCKIKS